jgi:chloramphenicol O-acetyltransferase type A
MENFKKREDRFQFFEGFENPLLNLCYELEIKDFRPYCKMHGHPVFHFFLYALFKSLDQIDNFKYRIFENQVIKIDKFIASYTLLNDDNLFNYTRFECSKDLSTFIQNSLAAKKEGMEKKGLIHTGHDLPERDLKNYVFITSLPWLRFTSIQHPVYRFKSADIPSIAWGKFIDAEDGKILVPFSVQAHHGFVDGYHIHLLGETLKNTLESLIK